MMTLKQLSQLFNYSLSKNFHSITFNHISIDSRTIQANDVYIAIRGTRLDGHDFLKDAIQKKACAAIVDHPVESSIPLIIVPDTTKALGLIAKTIRKQFYFPFVALTGSCGKTTTKTILAHILSQVGPTLSTQGTLNNEIGVPLTLLALRNFHQFAVIELGANHPKEIEYLASLTEPDVALITNVAPVHLEGFGSLDGVAHAKSEIYDALTNTNIAILNYEDAFYDFFKQKNKNRPHLNFGLHKHCDVSAQNIHITAAGFPSFTLHYQEKTATVLLPLLGQHNIMNALAAACTALALSIPFETVKTGLETVPTVSKRMNLYHTWNGARLIDDTYNANPTAFLAAIDFLTQQPEEKILVVGDMGELGIEAISYHEKLGIQAQEKGINALFAVGPLSENTVKMFGHHGKHFSNKTDLVEHLKKIITPHHVILVKGSRSAKMEDVIKALQGEF